MSDTVDFWKGDFGDQYSLRNIDKVESNTAFFSMALSRTRGIKCVLEFGAGIGQNISAIKRLLPSVDAIGVELNETA
jgi:tRNA G46 methylase TrmB